ncbi:MAG: pyruvate formate lyase family protein, partial [Eubacteriales bacterium]
MLQNLYEKNEITDKAKKLFAYERSKKRLDGWFIAQEIACGVDKQFTGVPEELKKAYILQEIAKKIPLELNENCIFAGTQDDGFARSYALINPSFKVEEFSGYCDPTAVFGDIEPNDEFSKDRIEAVRKQYENTPYVQELGKVYKSAENYTKEVAFFVEQVTGHLIPDFRFALKHGLNEMIQTLSQRNGTGYQAMAESLKTVLILAQRYRIIVKEQMKTADIHRKNQLAHIADTLKKVPENGAENLYEAIQFFILLWQVMCLEQTPNPFAFSVGNADRIFDEFRGCMDREEMSELFRHFLVFFNVADRSWAISQNIIVSGKDICGNDLTNETTYALLDAYYDMNLPQPILSVKLHKNTPDKLYRELGRFFFSPGVLTPSLFNDDALFEVLKASGVEDSDLPDIAIAGCQEPLIMGKDNGNTTNSWLNLPKILELTLNGGISILTGEKIAELSPCDLRSVREIFYNH